ncbi:uncharacterized protein LOC125316302 [Rhodamnia argentea]|uniref:Uncharacterized protein LOC125316302 n=1 Tax=Rhodamnia argentea TaxID=178133 RepID=A0ABM3HUK8_9MYRT|nr:uncharacterized protein LOC125316302 [Rhodamnia argentea]
MLRANCCPKLHLQHHLTTTFALVSPMVIATRALHARACATDSPSTRCPGCNNTMSKKLSWVPGPAAGAASSAKVPGGEGGYVRGMVTYMAMDGPVMKPMSSISCITLLNRYNVHEIGDLQEKVIDFGMDEAIKLLNASLHSKKVFTTYSSRRRKHLA